jgi:hypothetical protein
MRAKPVIKDLLLLFVGVSLGVAFSDMFRPNAAVTASTDGDQGAVSTTPKDGLVAYYFHGSHRCPTCRTIESLAHTSLQDEIDLGRIQWRMVDYDLPQNKHFSDDFELYSPSLVLVHENQGRVASWKNLERVWSLTDKPDQFAEYVHGELASFRESSP